MAVSCLVIKKTKQKKGMNHDIVIAVWNPRPLGACVAMLVSLRIRRQLLRAPAPQPSTNYCKTYCNPCAGTPLARTLFADYQPRRSAVTGSTAG